MKLDFDILRSLLQSIATRDPSSVAQDDEATLNSQRELLLAMGFAHGNSAADVPPKHQPLSWTYCHLGLSDSGDLLFRFSRDEALWDRAKDAYVFDNCSWSLDDLLLDLQTPSRVAADS